MRIHPADYRLVQLLDCDMDNGPWIAGGAVLKWLSGQSVGPHDIDVFFKDFDQIDRTFCKLKETYSPKDVDGDNMSPSELLAKLKEDDTFRVAFSSENATTLSVRQSIHHKETKVQLIKLLHKDADSVLDSFDLDICKFLTDGKSLLSTKESRIAYKTKTVTVHKWHATTPRRLMKYYAYGYNISGNLPELLSRSSEFDKDFHNECEYEHMSGQ